MNKNSKKFRTIQAIALITLALLALALFYLPVYAEASDTKYDLYFRSIHGHEMTVLQLALAQGDYSTNFGVDISPPVGYLQFYGYEENFDYASPGYLWETAYIEYIGGAVISKHNFTIDDWYFYNTNPVPSQFEMGFSSDAEEEFRALTFETSGTYYGYNEFETYSSTTTINSHVKVETTTVGTDNITFTYYEKDYPDNLPVFQYAIKQINSTYCEVELPNGTQCFEFPSGTYADFQVKFELNGENHVDISLNFGGTFYDSTEPFLGFEGIRKIRIDVYNNDSGLFTFYLDSIGFYEPSLQYQLSDYFFCEFDLMAVDFDDWDNLCLNTSGHLAVGIVDGDWSPGNYMYILGTSDDEINPDAYTLNYPYGVTSMTDMHMIVFGITNDESMERITVYEPYAFWLEKLGLEIYEDGSYWDYVNASLDFTMGGLEQITTGTVVGNTTFSITTCGLITSEYVLTFDIPNTIAGRIIKFACQGQTGLFGTMTWNIYTTINDWELEVPLEFRPASMYMHEDNSMNITSFDLTIFRDLPESNLVATYILSPLVIETMSEETAVTLELMNLLTPLIVIFFPVAIIGMKLGSRKAVLPLIMIFTMIATFSGIIPFWVALIIIVPIAIYFIERMRVEE